MKIKHSVFVPLFAAALSSMMSGSVAAAVVEKAVDRGPGTMFDTRRGEANVARRVAVENAVAKKTVAFLGGSITEMNGFRPLVMKALREKYPDVEFTEIASGLSSTCSDTGAFRLEEDMLAYGVPDLFIVEAAVNDDQDGHFDYAHCVRGMEGSVRHVLTVNPKCAVVVGLMVNARQYNVLMDGGYPTEYSAHAAVAKHYGAALADVGGALAAAAKNGGMDWKVYRDCHPSPEGCRFGADVVMAAIAKVFDPHTRPVAAKLPAPLDAHSYFHGRTLPLASLRCGNGWRVSRPDWEKAPGSQRQYFTRGEALWTDVDGAEMTVEFDGPAVGAMLSAGPDCAELFVSVDGGEFVRQKFRTHPNLHYPYTHIFADDLRPGKHVLRLRAAHCRRENSEIVREGGIAANFIRIHRIVVNSPRYPAPRAALLERIRSDVDVIGIVHWSVNTFQDREWGFGDEKESLIDPSDFDAGQIVSACRDGGIKGLVVVAKHHDGFCLWPTKTTAHNISKSPFRGGKGDYMMEMSEACRKNGVRFGVYVSPWDRNNAAYATDRYVEIFHEQIRELLGGRYGEVFEMWFDGANGGDGWYGGANEERRIKAGYYRFDQVFRFVRELQPKCCIFAGEDDTSDFRWPGNEKGFLVDDSRATIDTVGGFADGEYGNPNYRGVINLGSPTGAYFRQCEADFPLRQGWFFHPGCDETVKSPELLMKIYLRTVGNGGIMNIGISPDRRGRLPDADVAALRGFAELKRRFFANETRSGAFNAVVLAEDVADGERVVRWSVRNGGAEILSGASIGTKRIRTALEPWTRDGLSVEAFDAAGAPVAVSLRAYSVDRRMLERILAAQPPKRLSRRTGIGREVARESRSITYRYEDRTPFSNLIVTPDFDHTDGAPMTFRVSLSDDGKTWRTLPAVYRLDNVAANPVAQDIPLGVTNVTGFVRIEAVRTVKEGAGLVLGGVDVHLPKPRN